MSDNTHIQWADATWNPATGCTKVSAGCDNCYIERTPPFRMAHRRFTHPGPGGTTGVTLHPGRMGTPLRWRKPRRVFVNSLADLFHDQIPDEFIGSVWDTMATTPRHTYLILTKRPARMRALLSTWAAADWTWRRHDGLWCGPVRGPLPNVWLGVSVEDQQSADRRISILHDTPAAVRILSCEPLLEPVDLYRHLYPATCPDGCGCRYPEDADHRECACGGACSSGTWAPDPGIGWVIAGGESGPGARPMHPDWARSLRDQAQAAGVPFFFKQHGEWGPAPWRVDRLPGETDEAYKARAEATCATHAYALWANQHGHFVVEAGHKPWSVERTHLPDTHAPMRRWGKKAAGRELDGRVWDEYPATAAAAR